MYNFLKIKFILCHITHKNDRMKEYKCSICGGKMYWYGYDGLVCVKCGFVAQDVIISGKLPVV